MKSRSRCCSMRSTTTASTATASFYRCYLKPGALAQLRNSKITAKSMAKEPQVSLSQLKPTSESAFMSMPPRVNYDAMEAIPSFAFRFKDRHPRCLLRKKLIPVNPDFSES